jgi:hypothetical protein
MVKSLAILCVHGVGHQEVDPNFKASWTKAITLAVQSCDPALVPTVDFLEYDDLFNHAPLNPLTYAIAFGKLLASATVHGAGDLLGATRGLADVPEVIKWTAGMVAQWATEEQLRSDLRKLLLSKVRAQSYDAVLAHSLGSLICYDTFVRSPADIKDKVFVSFGSQIGNPAVRDVFAGRIEALAARKWYHLFNPDDHVMTRPLNIVAENFQQVITQFDIPGDVLNHNAIWYLGHANAVATMWRDLAGGPQTRSLVAITRGFAKVVDAPTRRALLVGINDYPDPKDKLEGCVNDVFLMSSVLQECGFDADDIRVVLNERATTKGMWDRLHWLLDGVASGDQRVLFYSGHGAQMPGYGVKGEPEHVDECLVPYDFDWSPAHAIVDTQFCELYSQLPYDSYFLAIFDCCHSGGLTRDGGPTVRGITPPDDVRHRALRWLPKEQMWVSRDFPSLNRSLAEKKESQDYMGRNGATRRLGRAMTLRTMSNSEYDSTRKTLGHLGPYLPILLEACQEQELSYEYRHGATSYGAYTFCLAEVLRASRTGLTFEELNSQVTAKLHRLKYGQTPNLVGAKDRVSQKVPWGLAQPTAKGRKKAAKKAAKSQRKGRRK